MPNGSRGAGLRHLPSPCRTGPRHLRRPSRRRAREAMGLMTPRHEPRFPVASGVVEDHTTCTTHLFSLHNALAEQLNTQQRWQIKNITWTLTTPETRNHHASAQRVTSIIIQYKTREKCHRDRTGRVAQLTIRQRHASRTGTDSQLFSFATFLCIRRIQRLPGFMSRCLATAVSKLRLQPRRCNSQLILSHLRRQLERERKQQIRSAVIWQGNQLVCAQPLCNCILSAIVTLFRSLSSRSCWICTRNYHITSSRSFCFDLMRFKT